MAACTRGPAQEQLRERALTTGTGGITPAFPAQWSTGYFARSPVNQLVATVARASSCANLAPAWARQDHTTWPSASRTARLTAHQRPPHSAPRFVTTRTPLMPARNGAKLYMISDFRKQKYFSVPPLDSRPGIESAHEFGFFAQAISRDFKRFSPASAQTALFESRNSCCALRMFAASTAALAPIAFRICGIPSTTRRLMRRKPAS